MKRDKMYCIRINEADRKAFDKVAKELRKEIESKPVQK